MGLGTLVALTAGGTAMQVAGTLQQGKEAEKIAKARAQVDEQNAVAVREASVEKARIQGERGRRELATQKGAAAASGIRINVGSPLVIEAETRAEIAKDIGFGLQAGRAESASLLQSAAFERAMGKSARKKSKYSALTQGIQGAVTIGLMGSMMPKTPGLGPNLPKVGTVPAQTGALLAKY